jgi:spore coat polysaccharide biosynthesis predicted glycosyltransferase SpsG
MKVFILTEGGKNIGFGHIARCNAIYEAFEEKGILPSFIINGDEAIRNILKNKKYKISNWLKEKDRLFDLVDTPDAVIIDSYLADLSFYKKVSEIAKISVYIDDIKRLNYPYGIVINGSIYAQRLTYPKRQEVFYLLGSQYMPLRKAFWDVKEKPLNKNIKNVLITFGGTDHTIFSKDLTSYLKNNFDFVFLNASSNDAVSAENMVKLMLKADICISGGGQTTYELARCGVPTIGIGLAENQLLNLKWWEKSGFLKFAGWSNNKDLFTNIKKLLEDSDYKERIKMSEAGRSFVNGQGARKIVEAVLKTTAYRNFKLVRCTE